MQFWGLNKTELSVMLATLVIITVATVGIVKSELKSERATCTTKKLTNSSLIVCTYKNKVLFNGEVNE